MKIEIWSDIACPWCYIGLNRFQAALDAFEHADGVSVQLRSFQLDPGLPESFDGTEVDYLAASKGIERSRAAAMTEQVAAVGTADGLRFDFPTLAVANSRRAHRLIHLAQRLDASGRTAWELKRALLVAHFADGRSIWDAEVLLELAASVGLPRQDAAAALDSAELDDEVAADIERAGRLGIHAVPTFVIEEKYAISGAQPAEAFAAALDQVWRELNPQPLITIPGGAGPACGPDGCAPAS